MRAFDESIQLQGVDGSRVVEVRVMRTAEVLFWCKAKPSPESSPVDLGPIRLDRTERQLYPKFDLARIGDEHASRTFMALVGAHLVREGIV